MKRLIGFGILLVVVAAFVAVFVSGMKNDPRAVPSPLVGQPAPDFHLATLDGGEVSLSEHRGKPVIVNFWASWCVPCRDEVDLLRTITETYADRSLVVLGVNIQDEIENARKFVEQTKATFVHGVDEGGKVSIDFGVYGVPETFFVDAEGRIAHKIVGPVTARSMTEGLRMILAENPL